MIATAQPPTVTDRFTNWSKAQLLDFLHERGIAHRSGLTKGELADFCRTVILTSARPPRRTQDIDGALATLRGTSQYYTYQQALDILAEEARKVHSFAEALELARYYLPEGLR